MIWCKQIRNSVAKLFMCKYYFGRKINATKSEHHFVGRESAATTAMYMNDWIIASLLREADKRYGHRLNPEGRSFGVGASYKLYERVKQILEVAQQEINSDGRSLVLVDLAKSESKANEAFIKTIGTQLCTGKARRDNKLKADAFHAGQKHAETISLNTQLAKKKGTDMTNAIEMIDKTLEINSAQVVQIEVSNDNKVVWVNVDGVCLLRVNSDNMRIILNDSEPIPNKKTIAEWPMADLLLHCGEMNKRERLTVRSVLNYIATAL